MQLCGAGYNQDLVFLQKCEEWRTEQESLECVPGNDYKVNIEI